MMLFVTIIELFIPHVLTCGIFFLTLISEPPCNRLKSELKEEQWDIVIVLKDICKEFENRKVLDNISFHISPGEKVGIIGLNGAGKTTLLNIMAGMLKPDSGFIRVNGTQNQLEHYAVLKQLSYVSGTKSQLWDDLPIKSSLENCMKMYGIDRRRGRAALIELDEVFDVERFMNSLPEGLSLGERMRCELVYGLLSNPKILMLDEAMIGLDVSFRNKIIQFFERYGKETKTTIVYTSHNLAEVERICGRLILMDHGKMIFDGGIDKLMKKFAPLYRMEIRLVCDLPDLEDLPVRSFRMEEDTLVIDYDKRKIDTAQILKHVMKKCKMKDIRLLEPDLEETIKNMYRRKE